MLSTSITKIVGASKKVMAKQNCPPGVKSWDVSSVSMPLLRWQIFLLYVTGLILVKVAGN